MDMGGLRGLITVLTLAAFLGICWWAYRPANRKRFEKDAMLVFHEKDDEKADEERRVARGIDARRGGEGS